jgi:hypothetical protein
MPKQPPEKLAQALRDNLKRRKQSQAARPAHKPLSNELPQAPPPRKSPPES